MGLLGSITGALGFGNSSKPSAPNYGKITDKTLRAQIQAAPELYRVSAEYQPKYAALAANEYNTFLNGYIPNYTDNIMPRLSAAAALGNTTQRTADINDISTLGPIARMALRNSNPDAAGLLDRLTQQANEGLDAGSMLTGDEMRNLNNSLRASMGARGISFGPAASYAEALAGSQFGQQLKQQRYQNALSILGANSSFYGDPFAQVLNRMNPTAGALGTLGNQAVPGVQGAGPSIFNPNAGNQLAAGWNQTQGQMAAANTAANGALFGSILGAGATLGGAAMLRG